VDLSKQFVKLKWYDYVIAGFQTAWILIRFGWDADKETGRRLIEINRKLWRVRQGKENYK